MIEPHADINSNPALTIVMKEIEDLPLGAYIYDFYTNAYYPTSFVGNKIRYQDENNKTSEFTIEELNAAQKRFTLHTQTLSGRMKVPLTKFIEI